MRNLKRLSLILTCLCLASSTANALDKTNHNFNISVQPLRFFMQTLSANAEFKVNPTLSVVVPARVGLTYVPLWNADPGWHTSAQSGLGFKIHLTGETLRGGFYIQPGLQLGWRNNINPYELQFILFLAKSRIGSYLINPDFTYGDNFLNTDVRFDVGYDWFFGDVSVDLSGGLAITNVFALGSEGGWFYLIPVPGIEFSVGLSF